MSRYRSNNCHLNWNVSSWPAASVTATQRLGLLRMRSGLEIDSLIRSLLTHRDISGESFAVERFIRSPRRRWRAALTTPRCRAHAPDLIGLHVGHSTLQTGAKKWPKSKPPEEGRFDQGRSALASTAVLQVQEPSRAVVTFNECDLTWLNCPPLSRASSKCFELARCTHETQTA
jgi:hypothetical protein